MFPKGVLNLNLSDNPITSGSGSAAAALIVALSSLPKLEVIHMKRADIDDTAFPSDLASSHQSAFEKLQYLDLEGTPVTRDGIKSALSGASRELDFDVTVEDLDSDFATRAPSSGSMLSATIKVIVGKRVVREAWEIEADRKAKLRAMRSAGSLRAAAAAQNGDLSSPLLPPTPVLPSTPVKRFKQPANSSPRKEVAKEQWEIEAEQGLLTEGGRRRARALAALQASNVDSSNASSGESNTGSVLHNKYWDAKNLTLTLPPLVPPRKALGHNRGFSLASAGSLASVADTDLALPSATLPLSLICSQSFADTLRILEIKGRRADPSFLVGADAPLLPRLEELYADGCGLSNDVALVAGETRTREGLLATLARIFPRLQTLDLSYNNLSSAVLVAPALHDVLLTSSARPGLRHLRLRGNRLTDLGALSVLAVELFAADVGANARGRWALEELDVRDNALEALEGELGMLPLDVFLVEGNV